MLKVLILILILTSSTIAATGPFIVPVSEPPEERYWEFGVGIGYVRFEQYPTAGEYSQLFLPVPTFQYRGRTLRADDREGAKAYLFKKDKWSIEMSGTGSPYLDSKDNQAREGMPDIPWMFALGPELNFRQTHEITYSLGVFQAVTTDFDMTRFAGAIFQGRVAYKVYAVIMDKIRSYTKYEITLKSTSSEVQERWFGVKASEATESRPQYKAKAGFLGTEFSIFQSFKVDKVAYYIGANYTHYGAMANQRSPLSKTNSQFNYLLGITYVLGESKRPSVPDEDTKGIINRK